MCIIAPVLCLCHIEKPPSIPRSPENILICPPLLRQRGLVGIVRPVSIRQSPQLAALGVIVVEVEHLKPGQRDVSNPWSNHRPRAMMAKVSQFFHFKSELAKLLHPSYWYTSAWLPPSTRGTNHHLSEQAVHNPPPPQNDRKKLTLRKVPDMNQLMRQISTDRLPQQIHILIHHILRVHPTERRRLVHPNSGSIAKHDDGPIGSRVRKSLDDITGPLVARRRRIESHVRVATVLISPEAVRDSDQLGIPADNRDTVHGLGEGSGRFCCGLKGIYITKSRKSALDARNPRTVREKD